MRVYDFCGPFTSCVWFGNSQTMSAEEVKLTNDVKQEYSPTDSTEKNTTTAPPPAQAKPAQEQTRTENLQRIQQRKLKVS